MFLPNKLNFKYKKYHRAHLKLKITKNNYYPLIKNGSLGLKILQFGFLLPKQLKAVYQTINKFLKKKGKIIFFAFPNSSLTTKPTGARMGKGKGKTISAWVFKVPVGFILCEIHTKMIFYAISILKIAQKKLPVLSRIIFF